MAFRPEGVFIADVEPQSRAEAAGFRVGDRVAGINGQQVDSVGEMFRALFRAERGGGPVSFMLRREGGLAVAVLEPEQDDSAADTDSSVEE
jgi:S1-C subfamily serine protease